jgi:hypothetical protein
MDLFPFWFSSSSLVSTVSAMFFAGPSRQRVPVLARSKLVVVECNIPSFYQILEQKKVVLFVLIEISQVFKTF